MALTKKQINSLESILIDIDNVQKYLLDDKTVVARITSITAMPKDTFVNKLTGETAVQFDKHVGTKLCYLHNAKRNLKHFLEANKK